MPPAGECHNWTHTRHGYYQACGGTAGGQDGGLWSQLETDARLEECHVRQDEVSRLEKALTETVSDRDSLQEWKEISQVREERGRKEMSTTIQELRLVISKTARTHSGELATKGE